MDERVVWFEDGTGELEELDMDGGVWRRHYLQQDEAELDNAEAHDVANSDVKLTWDLWAFEPPGLVVPTDTVERLLNALGQAARPLAEQRAAVCHLLELPAWEVAPPALVELVYDWLVKTRTGRPEAKHLPYVHDQATHGRRKFPRPSAAALTDALEAWVRGEGNVETIRDAATKELRGETAEGEDGERARALLGRLANVRYKAPTLYRGLGLSDDDAVRAMFRPGETIDLPLSSFTQDPELAEEYLLPAYRRAMGGASVLMEVVEGADGLDVYGTAEELEDFSADLLDAEVSAELEYLTLGRFDVLAAEKEDDVWHVRLRQQEDRA